MKPSKKQPEQKALSPGAQLKLKVLRDLMKKRQQQATNENPNPKPD